MDAPMIDFVKKRNDLMEDYDRHISEIDKHNGDFQCVSSKKVDAMQKYIDSANTQSNKLLHDFEDVLKDNKELKERCEALERQLNFAKKNRFDITYVEDYFADIVSREHPNDAAEDAKQKDAFAQFMSQLDEQGKGNVHDLLAEATKELLWYKHFVIEQNEVIRSMKDAQGDYENNVKELQKRQSQTQASLDDIMAIHKADKESSQIKLHTSYANIQRLLGDTGKSLSQVESQFSGMNDTIVAQNADILSLKAHIEKREDELSHATKRFKDISSELDFVEDMRSKNRDLADTVIDLKEQITKLKTQSIKSKVKEAVDGMKGGKEHDGISMKNAPDIIQQLTGELQWYKNFVQDQNDIVKSTSRECEHVKIDNAKLQKNIDKLKQKLSTMSMDKTMNSSPKETGPSPQPGRHAVAKPSRTPSPPRPRPRSTITHSHYEIGDLSYNSGDNLEDDSAPIIIINENDGLKQLPRNPKLS